MSSAVAAFHILGAMTMMACLVAEHLLLMSPLDAQARRRLFRLDALYGLTALAQILTGVGRLHLDKGAAFYMANPVFHAKIGLFVLLGLLSIYPTLRILSWRRGGDIAPAELRRVTMLVRVELLGLSVLPFLASAMARGAGL